MYNVDCGLRTADCGLRTADCGLRTADCGLRTADCGLRTADCGLRTADCGLRTADCGLRTADCGLRTADCGLRTADCGLRTVDCEWKTGSRMQTKMQTTDCTNFLNKSWCHFPNKKKVCILHSAFQSSFYNRARVCSLCFTLTGFRTFILSTSKELSRSFGSLNNTMMNTKRLSKMSPLNHEKYQGVWQKKTFKKVLCVTERSKPTCFILSIIKCTVFLWRVMSLYKWNMIYLSSKIKYYCRYVIL